MFVVLFLTRELAYLMLMQLPFIVGINCSTCYKSTNAQRHTHPFAKNHSLLLRGRGTPSRDSPPLIGTESRCLVFAGRLCESICRGQRSIAIGLVLYFNLPIDFVGGRSFDLFEIGVAGTRGHDRSASSVGFVALGVRGER